MASPPPASIRRDGLGSRRLVEVDGDDARALAAKQQRRLAADAAAGAGDQRDLACQSHRVASDALEVARAAPSRSRRASKARLLGAEEVGVVLDDVVAERRRGERAAARSASIASRSDAGHVRAGRCAA